MPQAWVTSEHREARLLLRTGDWGRLAAFLGDHFEREEREILPALRDLLPGSTGPVAVIVAEHRRLRELLDGPPDAARLGPLLASHFEKEEGLILPFLAARSGPGVGGGMQGEGS